MAQIADRLKIDYREITVRRDRNLPTPNAIEAALADDPAITHVAMVHCETTTGMLNRRPRSARSRRAARPKSHRRRDVVASAASR